MAAEFRNPSERSTASARWAPIGFQFSEPKAAEAAAILLDAAGGRMPYLRLIKLIYMADRESLHRFGRPIVGGRYMAMKLGPVTSEVLDAIQCETPGQWSEIVERSDYEVKLRQKAEIRLLSEA